MASINGDGESADNKFFPKIEEYGLIIIRIIELVMDPETLNKS